MGFFDALFGNNRPPGAKLDALFALSTAAVTFEIELGWVPAGRAGLVLHPATSQGYRESEEELRQLLTLAAEETKTEIAMKTDEYGYRWVVFCDRELDDLIQLIHIAGETLAEKGYDTQLLAAVFLLKREPPEKTGNLLYLIFNYKRGRFYPFIPLGAAQERDTAEEMRLFALMESELPWEKDVSRWYPLWGCPI